MRKTIHKKLTVFALSAGIALSAMAFGGVSAFQASAAGKVPVTPYIQYTFDTADTMLENSGSSAADSTKDYTLQKLGNATPVNMCYMGDVEFKDNAALYLEGANNPFANGDLTDFTIALEVTARYSSWYASVASWDGIVGDADNEDTNNGNYSGHKYMRVSVASKSSDKDWLRFIDNQTFGDEFGNAISNKAHWECYGRGASLYTGERTVTETAPITVIISVDKDSKLIAKAYMGITEAHTVTMELSDAWNLYEENAVKRFTLGGAYDSRDGQHLQMKLNGRMDNVRIYDFAMTEAQMADYATSEDKQLLVDGVEIDKDIVGGTITVDNVRPKIGDTVTITPIPDANAELTEITVNGEKIEAVDGVYTATMVEGGLFVSAKYIRTFPVSIDPDIANGTVTVDKTSAKEGETVALTVTPNSGYKVKQVLMNGATVEPQDGVYSVVMQSEEIVLSAEFAKWVSVSVKDGITGGTVTVNKTECWENENVIITIKADEGYEVKAVTANGVAVEKQGIVYKVTVTENTEINVQFGKRGANTGSGCGSSLTAGGATSLLAFGAAVVVLLKKKRK